MLAVLSAAGVSFAIAILATPAAIRVFRRRNVGQFIQEEESNPSIARNLNSAFIIVLSGESDPLYTAAFQYIGKFENQTKLDIGILGKILNMTRQVRKRKTQKAECGRR